MTRLFRLILATVLLAAPLAHSPAVAEWTVADNYAPAFYTASASQTTFTVPWAFEDADYVHVATQASAGAAWVEQTQGTGASNFAVSGEAGTSGSVVFVTGLSSGVKVCIWRDAPVQRTTNFGATISSNSLNYNLNRLTSYIQQVENVDYRQSIKLPITDRNVTVQLPTIYDKGGHAPIANVDEDAIVWSEKALSETRCLTCPPGVCTGDNAGLACTNDDQCPNGACVDGFTACDYISVVNGVLTCSNNTCPDGCSGDGGGGTGYCEGGTGDGNPCTDDADCPGGGTCTGTGGGICFGGSGDGDACTDDADCAGGGVCRPRFDVCWGGANDGLECTSDADCPSGFCVNVRDRCIGGSNDGDPCTQDSDCAEGGRCDTGDRQCQGGANDGLTCTDDSDCPSGICVGVDEVCLGGTNDGDPCTDDADCPGGGTCAWPDQVGVLGPESTNINSVAVWNSTDGSFIRDTGVRIRTTAIDGLSGFILRTYGDPEFIRFSGTYGGIPVGKWANYHFPWKHPGYWVSSNADVYDVDAAMMMVGDVDAHGTDLVRTNIEFRRVTYPITVFQPGLSTNNQLVARIYFAEPVNCADNFVGSIGKAVTAFTGSTVYNLQKNGSTIGTATFGVAGTTATFNTTGSKTSFATGDYLDIDGPATADATGADLSFTFDCVKTLAVP